MKSYARIVDGQVAQIQPQRMDGDREVQLDEDLVAYDPLQRPPPPLPTLEERIATLLATVDLHLDATAKARGYDGIKSAALRAGYPGPFHDEGVAFATWMDSVYATCYQLLAQWQAGEIAEPTPDELIALLPTLELPS